MLGFLWNFRLRNPFLSDRSNSRSISGFFFFCSAVARGGICVLIPNGGLIVVTYLLEIKYIACLLFSSMKLDRYQSNQGASAEALNTVESLSDKKGILAHKMAGVYIAIIGVFSFMWRCFSTHREILNKYCS